MEYSVMQRAGVTVSRLALGTVELGMDYGFRGSDHREKPSAAEAIRIIRRAIDLGINLIDTAPSYGNSEELIGKALKDTKDRPLIASKVSIPDEALVPESRMKVAGLVLKTIENSLSTLRVEKIDLLQIHNTSEALLAEDEVLRAMEDARTAGKVGFLGASCVGESLSLAALEGGHFDVLQLPFNLLDRQMIELVFEMAPRAGVGIMARSAFLRGVLAGDPHQIPDSLPALRDAAEKLSEVLDGEVCSLSELALRFCLSYPSVSCVVIGVRTLRELEMNVADAARGRLAKSCLRKVGGIALADPTLVNPVTWQGLI